MAIDVRQGDRIVYGGKEYPVRECEPWPWPSGRINRRRYTETASTKREAAMVDGKRGSYAVHLASIKCMRLAPVDAEIRQRLSLNTPHNLYALFVDGGDTRYMLILEDLK